MRNPLGVICAGALLTLTLGCSPAERQDVKESAEKGVKTAGTVLDNGVSSTKIKSALLATPKLDASKINVDTDKTQVYLRGSVLNQEQKSLALRLATDMVGKQQHVVDELKIVSNPK